MSRLRGLNESLNKAKERVAETQGHLQSVRSAIAAGQPVGAWQEMTSLVQLEARATELKERVVELERKFTKDFIAINPDMTTVFEQLKVVEAELAKKREQIQRNALSSAEQDVVSAKEMLRSVQEELDAHKRISESFSSSFAKLESLQSELAELEQLHRDVSQRMVQYYGSLGFT